MQEMKCLQGGPLFDGERLVDRGTVLFSREGILEVRAGSRSFKGADVLDVSGGWILPGLVDLHSDAVERCIEMRPGVRFDAEFALHALDQRLAACGITTFCHALTFSDNDFGLREASTAQCLVELISAFDGTPHRRVHHRIHARYEISCPGVLPTLEAVIDRRSVHLLSLTDHTPGQGQFKTLEAYLEHQAGTYGASRIEAMAAAESKVRQRPQGPASVAVLCKKARQAGIPLLSHDDDSVEKVEAAWRLGVCACEFPVSMQAVRGAAERGMKVFMGAPNLVRDRSSNGHLRASEAILAGLCDGLVSDYYPECLLQAPFLLHRRHGLSLEDAFKLVTAHPGELLPGRGLCGRLSPGSPADILVVGVDTRWARVLQTWVSGRLVFSQSG